MFGPCGVTKILIEIYKKWLPRMKTNSSLRNTDSRLFRMLNATEGLGVCNIRIGMVQSNDRIHCRERLGSMLNFNYREAA